jgi:crotonobetainyl-CoA:carnitine CoA-transferase CaiB-like acyl-CoA transferase
MSRYDRHRAVDPTSLIIYVYKRFGCAMTASSGDPTPLAGVRVLDLSNLLAGPLATMLLADFGAEVIKVEDPRKGDELRHWGLLKEGHGLFFKTVNRNKRLITCDLRSDKGQELIRKLALGCDVVVEGFRPGRLERWNLDYATLSAAKPSTIMLSISGYGQTGPYSSRPGFGTVLEAQSGYAYVTGEPDRPPLLPSVPLGDSVTAVYGALAVMLALYHRDAHGGEGQHIDLAIYEGLLNVLGPQFVNFDQLQHVQERAGSRLPFVAPRNSYQTSDGGWIAISGSTQATFERVATALGIEQVLEDPRFADNQGRIANAEALDEIIQDALSRRTRDEALAALTEAGAAVGPVNNVRDIFADPHFEARENIATALDGDLGPMRMQGVVPRLLGTPGRIARTPGGKGCDNPAVYSALLGLEPADLEELERAGVI